MLKNIKTVFIDYGWVIWALLVALVVLVFWFAFLPDWGVNYFFSSDALYLPSLYKDIFQDGYTLSGWTLNQASNLFPDLLLYSLLNAICGDFIVATFCYSVIQYLTIILFFYLIFKQINPTLHPSTFAPAIFLFASYLFIFFIDNMVWESALLNHNAYHNSAFIMALVCIYFFFKYLDTKKRKTLIVIVILSMLSGACDRLFIICFSIPAFLVVCVLYFFNQDRKKLIKLLITIVLGAAFAIVLWLFFKNNPYFSLSKAYGELTLKAIRSSWVIFTGQMYGYMTTISYIMVLTYLSAISYLATITYVIYQVIKLKREKDSANKMFVFQIFVLFFTPIVLLAPILTGSYGGFDTMRYNYFPYFLLPFNAVILASNVLNRNKLLRIIINTILSVLIVGYLIFYYPVCNLNRGFERFYNFYPEKVKTIDSYFIEDGTYKFGITDDYWIAKQVSMFSKKGVRLYSAFNGGDPWFHVANKNWFTDNDQGRYAHCEFTFLLWSSKKELPEIFKTMNDSIHSVELDKWRLYQVKPYRFIIPGTRFQIDPVLIDKGSY